MKEKETMGLFHFNLETSLALCCCHLKCSYGQKNDAMKNKWPGECHKFCLLSPRLPDQIFSAYRSKRCLCRLPVLQTMWNCIGNCSFSLSLDLCYAWISAVGTSQVAMAVRPEHGWTMVLHPISNSNKHQILFKRVQEASQKGTARYLLL